MSQALRQPAMTLETFLAWELRQELRYEFDGTGPVAMVGGTAAHSIIQVNLAARLSVALRGSRCSFLNNDLKVVSTDRVRYPDGYVVCSPMSRAATRATDPVVVFEVLSPSTARTDRLLKLRDYFAIPSVVRYVLIEQDFIGATVLVRDGSHWAATTVKAGEVLEMPEIGVSLPLESLYDGLDMPMVSDEA